MMKTMAVDIECVHGLVFFLKVPDHWTRDDAIQALGYPVIAGLAEKADKSEWGCTVEGMNLRLGLAKSRFLIDRGENTMSDAFIFHEDYFDDFVDWVTNDCMCSFPVSTDEFRLIATQYAETVLTDYESDGELLIAELCKFGAERHLHTPD